MVDTSFDYSFSRPRDRPSVGATSTSAHSSSAIDPSSSSSAADKDIWSQILLSVRTPRSTPVLPLLVLGSPHSGKTTLLAGLAQGCIRGYLGGGGGDSSGQGDENGDDGSDGEEDLRAGINGLTVDRRKANRRADAVSPALASTSDPKQRAARDLGLAYGYCDVPDEEGEDTLARLSMYTLASSDDALVPLIPHALQSGRDASTSRSNEGSRNDSQALSTIRSGIVLIVLDWQRPQAFLEELRTWIAIVKQTLDNAVHSTQDERQSRAQEAMLEDMKDAVEKYVRSYEPPPAATSTMPGVGSNAQGVNGTSASSTQAPAIVPVSAPSSLQAGAHDALPLDEGVLTDNLGVNIVVVLTKSDVVGRLERDRDFKEEQFDYIQQVLRTICLRYGAALFSTSQTRPSSFSVLRQYLLHRFFAASASEGDNANSTRVAFTHAPSTIERDVLVVPSGWDSWGKIVALRDGFSPKSTEQGWTWDCQVEERRRAAGTSREKIGDVERQMREEEGDDAEAPATSACRLWDDLLGDINTLRNDAAGLSSQVPPPDTQDFLASHYAALQKDGSSADPRAKFSRTNSSSNQQAQLGSGRPVGLPDAAGTRGVVGPMRSTSLTGPSVEKAIGQAQRDDATGSGASSDALNDSTGRPKVKRRESREPDAISSRRSQSPHLSSSTSGSGSGVRDRAASPSTPSPATTKQSEVLQSFFQDLLRGKSGAGGGGTGGTSSGGPATPPMRSSQNK